MCVKSRTLLLRVYLIPEHICCFQTAFQGSEVIIFSPAIVVCVKSPQVSCPFHSSDTHMSYLPLAHMFERVVQVLCSFPVMAHYCNTLFHLGSQQHSCPSCQGVVLVHGARIGFFQGDIRSLSDDLCTLKPTVFPVVPRLLNRIHDRVNLTEEGSVFLAIL